MKIRILSPCYVAGKLYKKGDVIDAADKDVREILGVKRGEIVKDTPPEPAPADTAGGSKKKGGGA